MNVSFESVEMEDEDGNSMFVIPTIIKIKNFKYLDMTTVRRLFHFREHAFTAVKDIITAQTIMANLGVQENFRLTRIVDETAEFISFTAINHLTTHLKDRLLNQFIVEEIFHEKNNYDVIGAEVKCVFHDMWNLLDVSEKKINEFDCAKRYKRSARTFSLHDFAKVIYKMAHLSSDVPWIKNYFESFDINSRISFNSIDIHASGLRDYDIEPFHVFRFVGMMHGLVEYRQRDTLTQIASKDLQFSMSYRPPVDNPFNLMLRNEMNKGKDTETYALDPQRVREILNDISCDDNAAKYADSALRVDQSFCAVNIAKFFFDPDPSNIIEPNISEDDRQKLQKRMRETLFFTEIATRQAFHTAEMIASVTYD